MSANPDRTRPHWILTSPLAPCLALGGLIALFALLLRLWWLA
jgi:hypothetical protein